jgi:hypothetical protein
MKQIDKNNKSKYLKSNWMALEKIKIRQKNIDINEATF